MEQLNYTNLKLTKDDFMPVNMCNLDSDKITRPSINYLQDAWYRLKKNKVTIVAMSILTVLIVMCLVGPFLVPWDYQKGIIEHKNQLPSFKHWFGTDKFGRDIFVRICAGGRISIVIGILGAFIDLVIGVLYGGIAGYFRGRVDNIMMRILEVFVSIPYLALVILISLIIGKGIVSLIIAMTITGWCSMARLVRGQVLQIKSQEFVQAAIVLGTSPIKIIIKHLLPNTISVIIVSVTFDIPSFIFGEAFLSYVGIGIQPPMTSWGALAADAQQQIAFYPYQLFFPSLMISLTMLSFQLLGDGLRDCLDPKLR